ncbi:spore germination protein [Paenibacillus sp. y28]|uniref:spore germination protein n=1 Tax=Paenibacillus sp. y28 TaxID=3129110 RepID=UPI003019A8F9
MNGPTRERGNLWTEHSLREAFRAAGDVETQVYRIDEEADSEVMFIYAAGLCTSGQIANTVLPQLQRMYERKGFDDHLLTRGLVGSLPFTPVEPGAAVQQLADIVFLGHLLVFFPASGALFSMNLSNRPERSPEESSTEISIKGPKDGFVEDITTNVALIRKRIRSSTLSCETMVIGRRTRTQVAVLYFQDIIQPKLVEEVRARLNQLDIDGLNSSAQLEGLLGDTKYSMFPLLDFTGRPDYAVTSLLAGRFVIVVDGNPFVLIGPATFPLVLKSPEDIHFSFQYVSFARLIRLISFALTLFLPGFWVALSAYHQDQFPFRLMATIAMSRQGLPFSAQMEMFILLLLLEIFREAGVRLPSSIGQTLTVIGGLVIGDAAIRAGLVSPSVVVVGAVTAVTSVTLVNQTMATMVSIIRLGLYLVACFLGMYGLILGLIALLFYMSKLKSFGVPYLSPLSPPIFKDMLQALMRLPWRKMQNRPEILHPIDPDHQKDDLS